MPHSCRVVGTGSIGSRYLRMLTAAEVPWIAAVSVRGFDDASAGAARKALWEDLATPARPHVDLTVIATRTARHVQDALAFAGFSGALLIEKPLARTAEEAEGLRELSLQQPVYVAAPLRFMDSFRAFRRLLPRVGVIYSVEVVCESWLPSWRPGSDYRLSYSASANDGGVLRDLVHEVDYVRALFGDPLAVSCVLAMGEHLRIEVDSRAEMKWRYPTFDVAMNLDFGARRSRRYISVVGSDGTLRWDVLEASATLSRRDLATREVSIFPGDLNRDRLLHRQMSECIVSTREDATASFSNAVSSLRLCDAARESHHCGGVEVLIQAKSEQP